MSFSKQFIEIMNAIGDKVGIAIDWTSKNVMPYLTDLGNRVVNYEIASSVAWIVIGIITLIISIIVIKKSWANLDELDELFVLPAILCSLFIIGSTAIIINQTFDIITAITIPEKTIYDLMKITMKSIK